MFKSLLPINSSNWALGATVNRPRNTASEVHVRMLICKSDVS